MCWCLASWHVRMSTQGTDAVAPFARLAELHTISTVLAYVQKCCAIVDSQGQCMSTVDAPYVDDLSVIFACCCATVSLTIRWAALS